MKSNFKIGDTVVLKQQPHIYPLQTYIRWKTIPGMEYTIEDIDMGFPPSIKLDNGTWVSSADIEPSYSEMLKRVLE